MRVLMVQYAGDYREAVYRFAANQHETYHSQRYSVAAVAAIAQQLEEMAVLCCTTETAYDERLPNGVRAIGAGLRGTVDSKAVIKLIEDYQPTHLTLNFPNRKILSWAIKRKIPTLPLLADSFATQNLRERIRHYLLAKALNHPQIQWVGNHGIPASESLQAIGVDANKIIPWDFVHAFTPDSFPVKTLQASKAWTLLYVGAIIEGKGVGEALEAVALLRAKNFSVTLKLAGGGNIAQFKQQAEKLEIADSVEFLGLLENYKILPLMRSSNLVLVPSRYAYPEGFPCTIYEALSARTPIVASDHPMFVRQLQHRENAMLFWAGNSADLAKQIETILTDAQLYQSISEAAQTTWKRLQVPVEWAELINRWIHASPENQQWLFQHRLSSGLYHKQAVAKEKSVPVGTH